MKRGLNEQFMNDLLQGELQDYLRQVQGDRNLILEIRDNYVNIYYRGGNLFKISQRDNVRDNMISRYKIEWDVEYIKDGSEGVQEISVESIQSLIAYMETYFKTHPKKEKFIQQEIVSSGALSGYLLTDFEYQKGARARFDLMGVRLEGEVPMLSFIELKQGYKSLLTNSTEREGKIHQTSGLKKHLEDILTEVQGISAIQDEIHQAQRLFAQKKDLGLFPRHEFPEHIRQNEIEVLFVLADFITPGSRRTSINLKREVDQIKNLLETLEIDIKLNVNIQFLKTVDEENNHAVERLSAPVCFEDWENALNTFYNRSK